MEEVSNTANTETGKSSAPQFAFFYLLSLVALIFMATSVGSIVFQIINKFVVDIAAGYQSRFDSDAIKFGISAIIIACPVYYLTTAQINKALFSGKLENNSGIRRWLSYLILFIASVIILGYLIGIIYSFLDGEITLKFILKALTAMIISGTIFGYYFYDVRRKEVVGKKDQVVRVFFYTTLTAVIITLISAFIFADTPKETRMKRLDSETIQQLEMIENGIAEYYRLNETLPKDLNSLIDSLDWLDNESLKDKESGKEFNYEVLEDQKFKLCADFRLESDKDDLRYDRFYGKRWFHKQGESCFEREIDEDGNVPDIKRAVPVIR